MWHVDNCGDDQGGVVERSTCVAQVCVTHQSVTNVCEFVYLTVAGRLMVQKDGKIAEARQRSAASWLGQQWKLHQPTGKWLVAFRWPIVAKCRHLLWCQSAFSIFLFFLDPSVWLLVGFLIHILSWRLRHLNRTWE